MERNETTAPETVENLKTEQPETPVVLQFLPPEDDDAPKDVGSDFDPELWQAMQKMQQSESSFFEGSVDYAAKLNSIPKEDFEALLVCVLNNLII